MCISGQNVTDSGIRQHRETPSRVFGEIQWHSVTLLHDVNRIAEGPRNMPYSRSSRFLDA